MVTEKYRNKYMAIMVGVTSLSVTLGPGFNSIFQNIPTGKLGPFKIEGYNITAWIVLPIYIVITIIHLALFKDYGIIDYNAQLAKRKEIEMIESPTPNEKLIVEYNTLETDIKHKPQNLNVDNQVSLKKASDFNVDLVRENYISKYKGLFYLYDQNLVRNVVNEEEDHMF